MDTHHTIQIQIDLNTINNQTARKRIHIIPFKSIIDLNTINNQTARKRIHCIPFKSIIDLNTNNNQTANNNRTTNNNQPANKQHAIQAKLPISFILLNILVCN